MFLEEKVLTRSAEAYGIVVRSTFIIITKSFFTIPKAHKNWYGLDAQFCKKKKKRKGQNCFRIEIFASCTDINLH